MRFLGVVALCVALAACSSSAPSASPPLLGALTITEPAPGAVVTGSQVLIRGHAPAGARVVHDISLRPDQDVIAGSDGAWALTVDLEAGVNDLVFRLGDERSTEIHFSLTYTAAVATPSSTPVATPVPTPRPTPVPTPKPTPTPAPVFAKLSSRTWALLVKDPDKYIGDAYQVWACITQFDAATGSDTFRGQGSYAKQAYWYSNGDNALFSGDEDQLAEFVEDDVVLMNVIVLGSIDYDTQIGGNTTAPAFLVDKITNKGSC
jgi:hypothetical protein